MKTVVKWFAVLLLFAGVESFSFANTTTASDKEPKYKIGQSVDLNGKDIVWNKGYDVVIESRNRYYLVKKDDAGHAIVVDKIHDLAAFVSTDGHYYRNYAYYDPYWNSPWVSWSYPFYYPYPYWRTGVVVRQPIVVSRPHGVRVITR